MEEPSPTTTLSTVSSASWITMLRTGCGSPPRRTTSAISAAASAILSVTTPIRINPSSPFTSSTSQRLERTSSSNSVCSLSTLSSRSLTSSARYLLFRSREE